jgi:hypothetical protein
MVCFQTKNPNLGKFLKRLAMEDVGIFYGHLVHFTVFCYILLTFGIVCGNLVIFPVLVFCTKKNLATLVWQPRPVALKGSVGDNLTI